MKKWETILKEYFKEILNYNGHKIFDTEHSVARFKERMKTKDLSSYLVLLKKGINWIIDNEKENIEDRYIFVSKKNGFGIQVHWREDRYTDNFNGYSATTLSSAEMKYFLNADTELFLENIEKHHKIKNRKLAKDSFKFYYRYVFEEDLRKEVDLINIDMFMEEEKIYYTYIFVKL